MMMHLHICCYTWRRIYPLISSENLISSLLEKMGVKAFFMRVLNFFEYSDHKDFLPPRKIDSMCLKFEIWSSFIEV